jgi:hypothetical protein
LIHTEDNSSTYFLGPVGISDPREFIEAESRRIPFKAAPVVARCFQELASAPNCRLEKLVQEDTRR